MLESCTSHPQSNDGSVTEKGRGIVIGKLGWFYLYSLESVAEKSEHGEIIYKLIGEERKTFN